MFLMDSGEIAEQIFGIFSFFIGIQFHLVNACKTKQGQLAVLVETGFCFELSVNEIGQEGQSQSLEQKVAGRTGVRRTDKWCAAPDGLLR